MRRASLAADRVEGVTVRQVIHMERTCGLRVVIIDSVLAERADGDICVEMDHKDHGEKKCNEKLAIGVR